MLEQSSDAAEKANQLLKISPVSKCLITRSPAGKADSLGRRSRNRSANECPLPTYCGRWVPHLVFALTALHSHLVLTFGFSTRIDFLSWIVVVALGLKIVATIVLLVVDKSVRDRPGWGSAFWWVTKIAPIIAVPCLVWIAELENDPDLVRLFLCLGLFVMVAVPLKILQRFRRISDRRAAITLSSV